jgi:hydroxymethylbilane synthase
MWKLGTRKSRLAVKQVEEFTKYFPSEKFEIVYFETAGDIDKTTPISGVEGSDFFTDTIDRALLDGEIDLAVHSAKDLPDKLPNGIKVAFVTESIDPNDVLVSKNNLKLNELPKGAKVGTSSQRRKEQLINIRNDLQVLDIRGNIDERLEKLDKGEYDAIILAGAGLKRLGLENRVTEVLTFSPHPMQGRLAVTTRSCGYAKGLFSRGRAG